MRHSFLTTMLLLALSSPAAAQVCPLLMRDGWAMPFGVMDQFFFMLSGPHMVVPAILTGMAILSPWYWLKAALGVAYIGLAALYTYNWLWPLSDLARAARAEGCLGNPVLFNLLLVALGLLVIWRAFSQRTNP